MSSIKHSPVAGEVIAHQLRLFGIRGPGRVEVLISPAADALSAALGRGQDSPEAIVLVQPQDSVCEMLGLRRAQTSGAAPRVFTGHKGLPDAARLRTLFDFHAYSAPSGVLLRDEQHGPVWVAMEYGGAKLIIVGTDLAADLIRYRQGDPAQAEGDRGGDMWGVSGERPVYLYASQREGEPAACRHADYWALMLAVALEQHAGIARQAILPGNAPGAVLITGDDDQAYLDKYAEQQRVLNKVPITYFLHPLTRHTRKTLRLMQRDNPGVDLGIHPDALETPDAYGERLREQMQWYRELVGESAESVRNHGYLNDGYWGHLESWERENIVFSSNLPGVCGTALNGSLLPGRMAMNGVLTQHWSLLTAFGDGMCSVYGWSQEEARERVVDYGRAVRDSGLPGVLVFNLHPQNVGEMPGLHQAVHDLIAEGFLAWNMRDCLDWALEMDGAPPRERARKQSVFARLLNRFKF